MRVIAYILTILVLLLSCIPCSDTAATGAGAGAIMQNTTSSNSQYAHIDVCSPFCICACCATNSVQPEQVEYPLCNIGITVTHTAFYFSFVQQIPFAVWQPPQLA